MRTSDNLGNTIVTPSSVNAKLTNKEDKSVKNILVESDDEVYTFKYDCTYEDEPLPEGVYALTGSLNSDLIKNYKTKNGVLIIDGDTNYTLTAENLTKYYGEPERLSATVVNGKGRFIPGLTVDFNINGQTYSRVTDSNGQASIGINLNSGKYGATVEFNGIKVYLTVTIKSTIDGKDVGKIEKGPEQYIAEFSDTTGKKLTSGTAIFNINGVFYYRDIDSNGQAKLNLRLGVGEYVITAYNPVSNEQSANIVKINPRFANNSDVTKYYRNATQYHITLLGDDGKAVGAGETVTFNINGVFYERTTNENGTASLNINLMTGDYVITAIYKECMISNKIKVLSIIKAQDIVMSYRDGTQFKATLLDGQGKPFPGQNITLNINGVFYPRVTDNNGMTVLTINLMPGVYIITTYYETFAISNKITIKS